MNLINEVPHRRFNPLTGDWVLVSPHRTQRPWQGKVETGTPDVLPQYDPNCYLCPGNARAGGEQNPEYEGTFVFTNDFSALLPEKFEMPAAADGFFRATAVTGTSQVLCFSPRHDLSLSRMTVEEIGAVVEMWAGQARELGERYCWVQIFENRGAMMGSSMPHPHGQVWASDQVPNEPAKEDGKQQTYLREKGVVLLQAYLAAEQALGERIVIENDEWAVIVPYWAVWPYETLLLPQAHVLRLEDLSSGQQRSLADILKRLLVRYDNLFETAFPYSMGWHTAPYDGKDNSHWQLHAHFYPPLLRSAAVRKFLVGYEMLAEAQRDITPEQAAERLRAQSERHYQVI